MSKEQKVKAEKLEVKVYSPNKVYFEGPASSVSAQNETGEFDILTGHHKFMTLLGSCQVKIQDAGLLEKIDIISGVMYVRDDRVTIFLDV